VPLSQTPVPPDAGTQAVPSPLATQAPPVQVWQTGQLFGVLVQIPF
jgi:hypothetical protein